MGKPGRIEERLSASDRFSKITPIKHEKSTSLIRRALLLSTIKALRWLREAVLFYRSFPN